MLNVIDEYSRKCLAIRPDGRVEQRHVIEVVADAMLEHGFRTYPFGQWPGVRS